MSRIRLHSAKSTHSAGQRHDTAEGAPSDRPLGIVVTATSTSATAWARRTALLRQLPLTVVGADWTEPALAGITGGQPSVKTVTVTSPLSATLVEMTKSAEMVVVAPPGGVWKHDDEGQWTLRALVRSADCSVVVVGANSLPHAGGPVVVGISGLSPVESAVIGAAFEEASRRRVGLVTVHTWSEPTHLSMPTINWSPIEWANNSARERHRLTERLAGFQDLHPEVAITHLVVSGDHTRALTRLSHSAQLVVVGDGRHPRVKMDRKYGSGLHPLFSVAGCPVLLARTHT